MSTNEFTVYAALDIGTSSSGYAFALTGDSTIHINQVWESGCGSVCTYKTPTCLLLGSRREFVAFGYEAENKYAELAEDNDHHDMWYFQRFKMQLYDMVIVKRNLMVIDETGKSMKAKQVFAMSIHYLVNHLMTRLRERLGNISEDEVYWILTVPAIWNEPAKTFMREAAIEAGIKDSNLDLALEPEAAAIFCKELNYKIEGSMGPFKTGTIYMLLDCGGGTIDVTVHEIIEHGRLMEKYSATGGSHGGKTVDDAFLRVIEQIVGSSEFRRYVSENKGDFYELRRRFEAKKRAFDPISKNDIKIDIPASLLEFCKENGKNLEHRLSNSKYADDISCKRDKLIVKTVLFRSFFDKALIEISDLIHNITSHVSQVKIVLLVGGFSAAPIIKQYIGREHPGMTIIVPENPSAAIMNGAVLYGRNPSIVSFRVSRCTYGIATCRRFRDGRDPEKKKTIIDGNSVIDGVFQKHIEIGTMLSVGNVLEYHTYKTVSDDQGLMILDVYRSMEENPVYVWDDGCTKMGELEVNLSLIQGRHNKSVDVGMTFTGTQLSMEAIIISTGELTEASFKLSDDSTVIESVA